jgi:hypothetical protein
MLSAFKLALATATAVAALANSAHAAATFNWVPISGGHGSIVLTDAAIDAGTFSFDYDHGSHDGTELNAPISSFSFGWDIGTVTDWAPDHFFGSGSFHLTIDGGRLAGSILATDPSQSVIMSGGDSLWTVTNYGSDNPYSACHSQPCSGQTGYWQLQVPPPPPPSSNVPEPASALLLLAGLAPLFRRRREG